MKLAVHTGGASSGPPRSRYLRIVAPRASTPRERDRLSCLYARAVAPRRQPSTYLCRFLSVDRVEMRLCLRIRGAEVPIHARAVAVDFPPRMHAGMRLTLAAGWTPRPGQAAIAVLSGRPRTLAFRPIEP